MTRGIVWFATPSPYRTCTYSTSPVRLAHYGPSPECKGILHADMVSLRPYIRLLMEDVRASEPCWKFARFPSFIKARPRRRVGEDRGWGSGSDRLCHHAITCAIHGWYRLHINRSAALLSPTALLACCPLRRLAVDVSRRE